MVWSELHRRESGLGSVYVIAFHDPGEVLETKQMMNHSYCFEWITHAFPTVILKSHKVSYTIVGYLFTKTSIKIFAVSAQTHCNCLKLAKP